jgi:hypothetical protein
LDSTHRLELDVVDHPAVLAKVVVTCHQRGCRIVSLHYERDALSGTVLLGVQTEHAIAQRLILKLANLIHVLDVREAIDGVTAPGGLTGLSLPGDEFPSASALGPASR